MCTLIVSMRRFLLLFVTGIIPVLVSAQTSFPDYSTVVKKFFSLYHHDDGIEDRLGFARKKDGWYVQLTNQITNKVSSDQVFWSRQKGRYQVLENFIGANSDPAELKATRYINQPNWYTAEYYSRCIYFGYDGWDADIIKDYSSAANFNDTLLESLARAYASYASRYSWYQFGGDSSTNDPLQKKLGRLELPNDARVKKMEEYISRAADLYNEIYKKNRLYATSVGNIALKTFNENLHGYLQMAMAERPVEAARFLDKCRIPANDSIAAKNLLGSIEANGILFTYGDAETYTSIYLQDKYNFRKDVAVVDINLLGLPIYLQYLKKKNTVNFSTTPEEFGKADIDISFYQPVTNSGSTKSLTDFIKGYKNLKKVPATGGDSVKVFDAARLFILVNKQQGAGKDSVIIMPGQYVTMDKLIVLDILLNNLEKRAVYFSSEPPPYLLAELEIAGRTIKIVPGQSPSPDKIVSRLGDYLSNVYKPPFINFTGYSEEYTRYVTYHILLYMHLLNQSVKNNYKAETDKLIQSCFSAFGTHTPYISDFGRYASWFYENKYEAIADRLAAVYIKTTLGFAFDKSSYLFYNKSFAIDKLQRLSHILKSNNRDFKEVETAISKLSLY